MEVLWHCENNATVKFMRSATEKGMHSVSFMLLVANIILLALIVRLPFISFKSADYISAYSDWYNQIVSEGYNVALEDTSIKQVMHSAFVAVAVSLFPYYKLLSIKLISIIFDFILAFFVYKCVGIRYQSKTIPILAALTTLLAPTVILNSALWGQNDAMYTAFLVACLYALLADRQAWAFVAFGLSLSIKLQAIFITPLFLWLLVKKKVNWRYFSLTPLGYLITLLPLLLVGIPLDRVLFTHIHEHASWVDNKFNMPNLHQWISLRYTLSIIIAIAIVLIIALLFSRTRLEMTREDLIVHLAALSVITVPFFLPRMHDRYLFPADIITIILAFYRPKYWYIAVLISLTSLNTYLIEQFEIVVIPLRWLPIIPLSIFVVLVRQLLPLRSSAPPQFNGSN